MNKTKNELEEMYIKMSNVVSSLLAIQLDFKDSLDRIGVSNKKDGENYTSIEELYEDDINWKDKYYELKNDYLDLVQKIGENYGK